MRIQNIQSKSYTPSFSSWSREVYIQDVFKKELKHRNDTSIYRDGELWQNLCKFFTDRYKNTEHVNVYCYGCSNGSEPYTFLMQMLSNYPEDIVKKFTPIIAKDYDETAIKAARSKELPIDRYEYSKIETFTNGQFNRFFGEYNYKTSVYEPQKELTEKVQFSQADILNDYINIKPENSIVFARNFWPYLENLDMIYLVRNLGKHLGKNSFIVTGTEFDHRATNFKLKMHLIDSGFKSTELDEVLEKHTDSPYHCLFRKNW